MLAKFRIAPVEIEWNIALPIGISFYTLTALGYLIDVYRGKSEAEHNFLRYALFVSFFPQILSGPIERSTNLLRQLRDSSIKRNLEYGTDCLRFYYNALGLLFEAGYC